MLDIDQKSLKEHADSMQWKKKIVEKLVIDFGARSPRH